jgi:hypothetical protein
VKIGKKKTVELDAKVIKVHAKPCDAGGYSLVDQDGEVIHDKPDDYVPGWFPDGGGDYIVLDIEIDTGKILNWTPPTRKQLEKWIEKDGDE